MAEFQTSKLVENPSDLGKRFLFPRVCARVSTFTACLVGGFAVWSRRVSGCVQLRVAP